MSPEFGCVVVMSRSPIACSMKHHAIERMGALPADHRFLDRAAILSLGADAAGDVRDRERAKSRGRLSCWLGRFGNDAWTRGNVTGRPRLRGVPSPASPHWFVMSLGRLRASRAISRQRSEERLVR